jgi:hypothetical protein
MRAAAQVTTPAAATSTVTGVSVLTGVRRGAAVALLLAVAAVSAGCTGASNKHQPASSGAGSSSSGAGKTQAATTVVPPPSSGDIRHTVAVHPRRINPAVALGAVGNFGNRVTVHVTSIKAGTAHARGPGEVTGPALFLTLRMDNASAKAINLDNMVVALEGSKHAPGTQMSAPPARRFAGSLPAGSHAAAVYVFTLPTGQRHPVTVKVSYTTEAPVVVFVGDAP